jgi:hypothetical protein
LSLFHGIYFITNIFSITLIPTLDVLIGISNVNDNLQMPCEPKLEHLFVGYGSRILVTQSISIWQASKAASVLEQGKALSQAGNVHQLVPQVLLETV